MINPSHIKLSAGLALAALLVGCATPAVKPTGITPGQLESMHSQGLAVVKGFDSDMIKATRTKRVLGTAGKILAMLSGIPQSFYGRKKFVPANLKGYGVWMTGKDMAGLSGPAQASDVAMKHVLAQTGISASDDSDYSVMPMSPAWGLRYTKMGSDQYRFFYIVKFSLYKHDTLLSTFLCSGEANRKLTLDAWQANHGRQLHRIEARAGGKCARAALVTFGLADESITSPGPIATQGKASHTSTTASSVSEAASAFTKTGTKGLPSNDAGNGGSNSGSSSPI